MVRLSSVPTAEQTSEPRTALGIVACAEAGVELGLTILLLKEGTHVRGVAMQLGGG